ncbi:MAG: hypothetical protein K2L11_01895 [Muribaculaceae bacterium]|nr:hypothetical protein [Muribaculaceae bacterium]
MITARKFKLNTSLFIMGGLLGLAACGGKGYRQYLDSYVEMETQLSVDAARMKSGISVYVDFSDGMNAAYGTSLSQEVLKKVVNSLTDAKSQPAFFSLADSKITPLDLKQTELYNAIMLGKNYDKPRAPIEETLKTIVSKSQPALLITDFEEYDGARIQQQNYAKTYFIDWLKKGYNITFYKIDYKEKSLPKHLYFTVFDSQENEFGSKIASVIEPYLDKGVERFVLAGPKCSYDIVTNYPSSIQGGSYHNSDGRDLVSAVLEDGKEEAYITYTFNAADEASKKTRADYSPFKGVAGPMTAYYPVGDSYSNVISNISATREEGVPAADRFSDLLSKVYVNFSVQDGYAIEALDVNVTDFEGTLMEFAARCDAKAQEGGKPDSSVLKGLPEGKRVLDMFTVAMQPVKDSRLAGAGWNEILFNFDSRFSGAVPPTMDTPNDLLKADIVISSAKEQTDRIEDFFAWPGNRSLAESVINTLKDASMNPKGQVIVRYYIKAI